MNGYLYSGSTVIARVEGSLESINFSAQLNALTVIFSDEHLKEELKDLFVKDGQVLKKPVRPSPVYVWDTEQSRWVESLIFARATKLAEVKQTRTKIAFSPTIETPFGIFQTDKDSVDALFRSMVGMRELSSSGNSNTTIDWTLADNTLVTLTIAQLSQVVGLITLRENEAHAKARALRATILSADLKQIQTIRWDSDSGRASRK